MTYKEKSEIVIRQLREDRDRLLDVLEQIRDEIANEKGTFPKEHYVRIIDKYRKGEQE